MSVRFLFMYFLFYIILLRLTIILFYSGDSVKTTLLLLRIIRLALTHPEHRAPLLAHGERIALKYSEQFSAQADAIEDIENEATSIMTLAHGESTEIIQRFNNLREEHTRDDAELKREQANEQAISRKIKAEESKIRNIESNRKILMKRLV